MNDFLIALQFLTRLPVAKNIEWNEKRLGATLLWYPLVGACIGVVLILLINILPLEVGGLLLSALVLSAWVLITGGLHLDGLADSADAWVGGHGNKQRSLEIMKDPQAGPIAVIVLLLLLLIKFAAIYSLLQQSDPWLLLWPLVFGRCVPMILFLTTPYVRQQGLGSAMANNFPHQSAPWVLASCLAIAMFALGFINAIILVCLSLAALWFLRYLMLKQINGMTGDTIGASIEIIEALILCLLVMQF